MIYVSIHNQSVTVRHLFGCNFAAKIHQSFKQSIMGKKRTDKEQPKNFKGIENPIKSISKETNIFSCEKHISQTFNNNKK